MSRPEDLYGYAKCAGFISEAIARYGSRRVLDIGCGTGEKLTVPVANANPRTAFVAVDADARSISHAQTVAAAANVQFKPLADLDADERFDLVIASEVIEHVEAPAAFLAGVRARLTPGGRVLLTVPNGYGPSELAASLEAVFTLTGVLPLARWLKRALLRSPRPAPAARDTLAVSPHINFFSWGALQRLVQTAGFRVAQYRPRTLFCGFGFEYAIRSPRALRWNAEAADRVHPRCVSGWMLVLEPAGGPAQPPREHRRGAFAGMRRWLNEKRWGLR